MTSPFSCSAASSGLPRLFHMSKPGSKWGPSSPGQELLCVSRRKFANLDLLRIRHFEKFDFRSDTHGTGLIHGKYQTGNRAIWLVDFLYQPSQELSRVINCLIATMYRNNNILWASMIWPSFKRCLYLERFCIMFQGALLLHYLWLAPLQMFVISCLLWQQLGVSCLVGVGLLILFIPHQVCLDAAFTHAL